MLETKELECIRGDRRLFSALALQLKEGELLHVQGDNGSGKSTLLRTLCGLHEPTRGEVYWQGKPIRRQRDDFTQEVLFVGHKTGIKEDLSAVENLRFAMALAGHSLSEERAWQTLEKMGLCGFEDLPCRHLSQGQKRRVGLTRLLLTRSRLWILDEPFTALDSAAVNALQSLIGSHLVAGGSVVLTTHQEIPLVQGEVKQLRLGCGEHGDV